jgi:hypothetical protein
MNTSGKVREGNVVSIILNVAYRWTISQFPIPCTRHTGGWLYPAVLDAPVLKLICAPSGVESRWTGGRQALSLFTILIELSRLLILHDSLHCHHQTSWDVTLTVLAHCASLTVLHILLNCLRYDKERQNFHVYGVLCDILGGNHRDVSGVLAFLRGTRADKFI